ncbi:hypothetical protein P43SY_004801 [Pythium insidiosum]|uniref:Uncharacterized protein n=1 Tax=Pythium insidiosum TaxID=114742 RepID=A0AAD5LRL8_PYTIN|nr:hypothetical protein P43SY_004801 [Pythium insidiosum]
MTLGVRANGAAAEEDEEAQELAAWMQEARRYLLKDVGETLNAALQELERIDFLWGRIRLSKLTLTPAIKADIRVEGHLVVFTSLELKLSRPSRNAPVMASLQQYCVLNQILEFHSVMQTQLSSLQATRDFLSSAQEVLEHGGPSCDVALCLDVLQKMHVDLVAVCRQLRSASNVLRLPSRRRFPYSAYVDHSFKPALPPEVIVDFSIHRGELLMEAFGLALTPKPLMEIPDGCCTKKEFVETVCLCRGQKVEIVDYASISVPIPQIEEMLTHLDEQLLWLVRTRDNIKALLDCH